MQPSFYRHRACPVPRLTIAALVVQLLNQSFCAAQTNFLVLRDFGFQDVRGFSPQGSPILGSDGNLYGTTSAGGFFGKGTVFRVNQDGTGLATLKSFAGEDGNDPVAGLVEASDGRLYGVTQRGGTADAGVAFGLDRNGSNFAVLHMFEGAGSLGGQAPKERLIEGTDGRLYGTTDLGGQGGKGLIFSVERDGSDYMVLHHFMGVTTGLGSNPRGLVEGIDGKLYGTTWGDGSTVGGTFFRVGKDGDGYTTLRTFNVVAFEDPRDPQETLWLSSDGYFYGTFYTGGAHGWGAAFRIKPDGSDYSVIYNFGASSTGAKTPLAGLIEGTDGFLYGTTWVGGESGYGTVFKLAKDGGTFDVLYSFAFPGTDGIYPYSGVVEDGKGRLFGMTAHGGTAALGTLYEILSDGSDYRTLNNFQGAGNDGWRPRTELIEGTDGMLYGTANGGGTGGVGIVFKMETDGSAYQILHHFQNNGDGRYPHASLLEARNGMLFGATSQGGINSFGTIFKLAKDGSGYQIVRSFAGPAAGDGRSIFTGLMQAEDDHLYGVAESGGPLIGGNPSNAGLVFRLTQSGTDYAMLHGFGTTPALGTGPRGPLVEGPDGLLYGVTGFGGTGGGGAIFKLNKNGSNASSVWHFAPGTSNGRRPNPISIAPSGTLYGTTEFGGASDRGIVFRVGTDGSDFTILHSFTGTDGDGRNPRCGVLIGADSRLYGVTTYGGATNTSNWNGSGVVYSLNMGGGDFAILSVLAATGETGKWPESRLLQLTESGLIGQAANGGNGYELGAIFALQHEPVSQILGYRDSDLSPGIISARGAAGVAYRLQQSGNLVPESWSTISTNTASNKGALSFTNVQTGEPRQFFRLVSPEH